MKFEERFWSKVEKGPDCWIWKGSALKPPRHAYGQICAGGHQGKLLLAHRVAYELLVGPIPDGMSVLHRCDNPRCVNPAHLFLGTQSENTKDAVTKNRWTQHGEPGEENPSAVLTWPQVDSIRELYRKGDASLSELAQRFGVGKSTIHDIIHEVSWKLQEGGGL
jgi:hypothetical protein